MLNPYLRPDATQHALDIHQTAHVASDHSISAGFDNIFNFIRHHGSGDIRIFYRKSSAKPTALI